MAYVHVRVVTTPFSHKLQDNHTSFKTCGRVSESNFVGHNYLVHPWDISWAFGMRMVFSWFYCTCTLRFHCTKKYAMHPLCWCLCTSTYISSVINKHTHSLGSPLLTGKETEFEHSYIHVLSHYSHTKSSRWLCLPFLLGLRIRNTLPAIA